MTPSEYAKQWYLANREKVRAKVAEYKKRNKSKILAASKRYREEKSEQIKASRKAHRRNHRELLKQTARKYYIANRQRILARVINYAKQNASRVRENKKAWELKNKERLAKKRRAYAQTNRERLSAYNRAYQKTHHYNTIARHNYRARKKKAAGLINRAVVQMVYEDNVKKFGTLTCYLCLNPILLGQDCLEHRIPLARGGSNLYENLQVAHRVCNNKKGAKTDTEYFVEKSGVFDD